jgi:hypothetical protein
MPKQRSKRGDGLVGARILVPAEREAPGNPFDRNLKVLERAHADQLRVETRTNYENAKAIRICLYFSFGFTAVAIVGAGLGCFKFEPGFINWLGGATIGAIASLVALMFKLKSKERIQTNRP